jgi:AraC-like DNA-binding protein
MITVGRVTVSARPAKDLPFPATPASQPVAMIDMRGGTLVRAGSFSYEGDDVVTGWHAHDLHQIEYAFVGVAEVETSTSHHLLPPQQAAWIPAGLAHCTTLRRVRSVSVFFDPAMVPMAGDRVRILAAAPVIREMLVYAMRWPIDRRASDPTADAYFEALALLARDWLDHEAPLSLPTSSDPVVSAVMEYTRDHLSDVVVADVCAAVGLSERTLRRQFGASTGITWRRYLLESRLLRSMALLTESGRTVLSVATDVGFDSVSAFTRAFARFGGETPSAYRRRVVSEPDQSSQPA